MKRFDGPIVLPRHFTLGDITEGLRLVRREIDTIWRCVRDLVAEDPDFDRADACCQIETAIYKTLDNLHMCEDYIDDISKAEVNAASEANGGAVIYPEAQL